MIDEEAELDRLYGLPLEEFTAARNDLSKRFRDEGERAIATRIRALKKPTRSAWTVNQLARRRELDVERLLKAAERLRKEQLQAVVEGDQSGFLEASRDEQAALRRLTQAARELLEASERSPGVLDRVTKTLRAAAGREDGRQLLKGGRLAEDVEPQGFEAFVGVPVQKRRPKPRPSANRAAVAEAKERLRELRRGLDQQRQRMKQAAEAAEQAARDLKRAEADFEAAERTVRELES